MDYVILISPALLLLDYMIFAQANIEMDLFRKIQDGGISVAVCAATLWLLYKILIRYGSEKDADKARILMERDKFKQEKDESDKKFDRLLTLIASQNCGNENCPIKSLIGKNQIQ